MISNTATWLKSPWISRCGTTTLASLMITSVSAPASSSWDCLLIWPSQKRIPCGALGKATATQPHSLVALQAQDSPGTQGPDLDPIWMCLYLKAGAHHSRLAERRESRECALCRKQAQGSPPLISIQDPEAGFNSASSSKTQGEQVVNLAQGERLQAGDEEETDPLGSSSECLVCGDT
jgi:hypothetical protein